MSRAIPWPGAFAGVYRTIRGPANGWRAISQAAAPGRLHLADKSRKLNAMEPRLPDFGQEMGSASGRRTDEIPVFKPAGIVACRYARHSRHGGARLRAANAGARA